MAHRPHNPLRVTATGSSFRVVGRIGSWTGIQVQLSTVPAVMAPRDRQSMGVVLFVSSSLHMCRGLVFVGIHKAVSIRRTEYPMVNAVAINIMASAMRLVGLKVAVSRIRSFV